MWQLPMMITAKVSLDRVDGTFKELEKFIPLLIVLIP